LADIGKTSSCAGRVNTVLVFGHGDGATAVISTIVARVRDKKRGKRARFTGPATFEKKTTEHVLEVVLPAADNIFRALNLPEKNMDISIVNLDAASIMDIGLNISGFSADVPILLAILSACLQMIVPQDVLSTGHVASPDGDIRMVKNMSAKLEAALKAESIKRFVHPAVAAESPLDSLSPGERQSAADALTKAKRDIKTIAVRDIGELVEAVFSDEQGVLASLRQGFYSAPVSPSAAETPCGRAVEFLAQNNEKSFWTVLGRQLLEGRNDDARDLLLAFAQFQIQKKTYPKGLGSGLLRLIQSLPPQTRRVKLAFPLLPMPECIQLSQFAGEPDHEDLRFLFRAGFGEKIWPFTKVGNWTGFGEGSEIDHEKGALQSILSEISAEALTNIVGLPIDTARAAYIMDSVTVHCYEEFTETIISFYLHLIRQTRKLSEPVDSSAAGGEAFALLERTFSKKGGLQGALAEARDAINGGLRLVFDMVTDQFKREEQEKHVNRVLKSALDPLDWKGKVSLMGALLKSLEPHLEPEILSQPPERFAVHYEEIIRGYLQSMDRLNSLFRSL
jgi:hypothetical protein